MRLVTPTRALGLYGVEINGNDGQTHDVKVDAGNAEVLHQDVDGADENSGSENVG